MARYELLLKARFTAAHQLKMPDGELEPLHRHDWRVEVFLEGDKLDAAGLLADFTVLQRDLTRITGNLQGRSLNDLPAFAGRNPSTEALAGHLYERIAAVTPANVRVAKVRVWETENCAAAYIPDTMTIDRPIGPDAPRVG